MSLKQTICLLYFIISFSLLGFAQKKDSSARKFHLLVFPVVSRSVETDWNFGFASATTFRILGKDTITRTSNIQAAMLYSLKKQFFAGINGTVYFPKEKFIASYRFSYSNFPDKFWGIGNKTKEANAEPYTFRQFYTYLHGQRSLGRKFFGGIVYEFQRVLSLEYADGGLFDQQQVTGREPYTISGFGPSITYDTRRNAFTPLKGELIQFSVTHFEPVLGSSFRYTNYILDVRKYFRVNLNHVLALQGYGFFNSGEVPLRSMATLGGSSSMRGYYDGRYIDKNQLVLQAEYRMPVYRRFGLAFFGGTGDVSRRLSFSLKDLKYSYGGGIRFVLNRNEKLNLRLDYGIGSATQKGFYFQVGEAF